ARPRITATRNTSTASLSGDTSDRPRTSEPTADDASSAPIAPGAMASTERQPATNTPQPTPTPIEPATDSAPPAAPTDPDSTAPATALAITAMAGNAGCRSSIRWAMSIAHTPAAATRPAAHMAASPRRLTRTSTRATTPGTTAAGWKESVRVAAPPDTGGRRAISSPGDTGSDGSASSPFSHTRAVSRVAANSEPNRSAAAATTSPTVAP